MGKCDRDKWSRDSTNQEDLEVKIYTQAVEKKQKQKHIVLQLTPLFICNCVRSMLHKYSHS